MASNKIYYVRLHSMTNPDCVLNSPENPMSKGDAIHRYEIFSLSGWRVWVEDIDGNAIAKNF